VTSLPSVTCASPCASCSAVAASSSPPTAIPRASDVIVTSLAGPNVPSDRLVHERTLWPWAVSVGL
jgi:hypothetical protein